jgi:hypothetical protein
MTGQVFRYGIAHGIATRSPARDIRYTIPCFYSSIKYSEVRRGHCLTCKPRVADEIRFVNKLFDIAA